MKFFAKYLASLAAVVSTMATASVPNVGANYNWYEVDSSCPAESFLPLIPNFLNSTIRPVIDNQLRIMKLNGTNTIDILVGLDENYGAGAIYPNIRNESDQVKIQHLNSYFSVVNQFASDVSSMGIPNMVFKIGGWSGAGTNGVCLADGTVNESSVQAGIADGIKVIDALMTSVINNTALNVKIDLGAEISPSNYEPQCSINGKTEYIQAIWKHYADTYPAQIQKGSFSSILLDTANASDAGNTLRNLINAISATGRQMPSWFSVHAYDVDSAGNTTTGATLAKMLGVSEVYSEFGFLSNQASPKETVIGEIHYQDINSANEIYDFLTNHDGSKINLSTIVDWPLRNPISTCVGAVNVNPPYKTIIYNNKLNKLLNTQQLASTISTNNDPVVVQSGQLSGSTTISWNTSGYGTVGVEYSMDGGTVSAIVQAPGVGSTLINWIQPGHTYTFFLKPVVNGLTDETTLLDSVTVAGVAQAQISKYVPIVPVRLLDSRPGSPTVDGQFAGSGPVASGSTLNLTMLGRNGIPLNGVGAVMLNVTVVNPTGPGYLTVWPTGATMPLASSLNLAPGQAISNQVIAKTGANGQISIYLLCADGAPANVVVDIAGYFPSTSDFTSLNPARILDTRSGSTTIDGQFAGVGSVGAGATLKLAVLGRGGVPASGVSSVVVNMTVTNHTTAASYLTVWPSDVAKPFASNLNFVPGQTIGNLMILRPGADGTISIYNNLGTTDIIADVVGYFPSTVAFAPLVPARLLDTRSGNPTIDGQFAGGGAVGSGGTLNLTVLGRGGVPGAGVGAVALNITAVTPTTPGYITSWGTGTTTNNAPPLTMDVNFTAGSVIQSLVIAQVGPNGQVSLFNSSGSTHIVADVVGWFPKP